MKKVTIIKWIVQFSLGSLFVLLAERCLRDLAETFIKGDVLLHFIVITFLASTAGVVFGDLSLYKHKGFSFLALLIGLLGGAIGAILVVFYIDLTQHCMSTIGSIADAIGFYAVAVLPPMIAYNTISRWRRKTTNFFDEE